MLIVLVFIALAHSKLYNVAPEADLAYVREQLVAVSRDYANGIVGEQTLCIPVTSKEDGRQRAYKHARHLFVHHGIYAEYETYRDYLQRGAAGTYDNRFCVAVSDLEHVARILARGELL